MNIFSTVEANKLNNMQLHLEKNIESVLEHLKQYHEYEVIEPLLDMSDKRQLELETLKVKVKDILEPLRAKIELLRNKNIDVIDFKQFKREMIIIQENIQTLKTESKTASELLKEESIDIWEDLHFYNERLLTWGEPIKIDVSCNFLKPKTINSNHKCKEVKQFMDFLHQTGGHENGWRKEDHQLFVKFRNKYKDVAILANSLHEELPDISIEEIKRHEEWYKKYINLQKRKKDAIKSWKKIKTARKTPMTSSNVAPKLLNAVQEPDETIQQKLMKWKSEREEKLKSVRELEFYEEQRKRKSEQLKRKQQEEIRKVVREWKEGKQIIEQQEIAQRRNVEKHEKKVRALEANRMIKQFQSQDDMYILKMRQQKKREIAPQVKRGSSCVVKRDPERLLKPTKQWINRVHDENYYANELSRVMDLKSLPKLLIPEWRKELK